MLGIKTAGHSGCKPGQHRGVSLPRLGAPCRIRKASDSESVSPISPDGTPSKGLLSTGCSGRVLLPVLIRSWRAGREDEAGSRFTFSAGGVHGPSEVLAAGHFDWTDSDWRGLPLRDLVFYEIHVGTFTAEGTFDAIIPRLRELTELGITAIELMPVAQFPGQRNWGYDGVFPFSVQNSYGGPLGLRRLVNACHAENLCVALDVVYNHLGPEGNYLADFGPYFTDRYRTPCGPAVNFDGEWSDEVRRYFVENALYWIRDFHIDILRLDAVHAIVDTSAKPFLRELNCAVGPREPS